MLKHTTKGKDMRNLSHHIAKLILITAFAAPVALFAAEKAPADHEVHHPTQVQSPKTPDKPTQAALGQIQETMHARMLAMQNTRDPQARQDMMMAQMQDMMTMMESGCPMMQDMGSMMGGQGGMMGKPMNRKPSK
jgi:hypothetical protein